MIVVNIPLKAPAENNCTFVSFSSGELCCSLFPTPYPKKLIANIGATPHNGAAIPEQEITDSKYHYKKLIIISRFSL